MPPDWDVEADVVVVGFGAAGACAALEAAAAGCSVLILDRFGGGGATALSGGVVYAGGGTPQQRAAGVTDTPEAMFGYLRTEVGDAVPAATLREFCDGSVAMLAWLEGHGVPFEGSLCPDKTSYPTNRHYLYYSGSELSAAPDAARRAAAPPRGPPDPGPRHLGRAAVRPAGRRRPRRRRPGAHPDHRPAGWSPTRRPGHRRGVPVAARRARLGPAGPPRPAPLVGEAVPVRARRLGRVLHRPVGWLERRYARPLRVGAARGVVLAAGGFAANRPMMRAHAPTARGGLPLATPGDDGSGIRLGTEAGGATAFLDRVSVWRFLSPPPALLARRAGRPRGRAGLRRVPLRRRARRRDRPARRPGLAAGRPRHPGAGPPPGPRVDPVVPAPAGLVPADLRRGARAPTVAAVAARAGVDPDGLAATLAAYNAARAASPAADPTRRASPPPCAARRTSRPTT